MTIFQNLIEIIPCSSLSSEDFQQIMELCHASYNEDLRELFTYFKHPIHLVIRHKGRIVSHACIVERWLKEGDAPLMRTAYIEAVCTAPELQSQGYASHIMRRAVTEAEGMEFDVAALCTGRFEFYGRLGWERWRGPLYCRRDGELIPCPEEEGVMLCMLPRTPPLNHSAPLFIEWRGGEIW